LWTFDEKGIAYLGPIREIGRKDALRMQPDQEFQSSVAIRGVGQRIGARYRSSWKRKLHELPGDEFRFCRKFCVADAWSMIAGNRASGTAR